MAFEIVNKKIHPEIKSKKKRKITFSKTIFLIVEKFPKMVPSVPNIWWFVVQVLPYPRFDGEDRLSVRRSLIEGFPRGWHWHWGFSSTPTLICGDAKSTSSAKWWGFSAPFQPNDHLTKLQYSYKQVSISFFINQGPKILAASILMVLFEALSHIYDLRYLKSTILAFLATPRLAQNGQFGVFCY